MRFNLRMAICCLPCAVLAPVPVSAQPSIASPPATYSFEERLGTQLPLDMTFRDEAAKPVRLGDLCGSRPIILALIQYQCPMLCSQVLNGLIEGVKGLPGRAGERFEVLVVSFDPREGAELAAARKKATVEEYGRPGADAGWHFWTGEQQAIDAMTSAVGFRYAYSRPQDRFAHPTGLVVLTSEGKVSGYLHGIDFPPGSLDSALARAEAGQIGPPTPPYRRVLLLCYDYDPVSGYSFSVLKTVRFAGGATVLVLGVLLVRS